MALTFVRIVYCPAINLDEIDEVLCASRITWTTLTGVGLGWMQRKMSRIKRVDIVGNSEVLNAV